MGNIDRSDSYPSVRIDTTRGSLLHRWRRLPAMSGARWKMYAAAIAATYLPMVTVAMVTGALNPATSQLALPFSQDWNVAFLFLVSFPCLVVLTATDDEELGVALQHVQADGVMVISGSASEALTARWTTRFGVINRVAYVFGAVVGALVAYLNYVAYVPETVGYWIADHEQLRVVGYLFLFSVFMVFALIPVYVSRTIAITMFLRDAVAHAELQIIPFHPDRCGGLRPVGQLGLRTQYGLTVFGLNVVSLVAISILYLNIPSTLYALIAAAAVAYLILGPVVFVGPLLPFRSGMLRTKAELMGEVAARLRLELQRLRRQLPAGDISKDDEDVIDRLRKLGAVFEELPVWPFDAGTLRKFLTAYVIPIGSAAIYPILESVVSSFRGTP